MKKIMVIVFFALIVSLVGNILISDYCFGLDKDKAYSKATRWHSEPPIPPVKDMFFISDPIIVTLYIWIIPELRDISPFPLIPEYILKDKEGAKK